ncbi:MULTISPECIES: hypothetical protein [Mycobacterium]|uniref:Polyketide cyclase n=1 Tax=Mycobacterium bouchedurhonense TaxID=701041 RepID=A0AAW5S603_MYCBC|nr:MULTISPECIES: hypothetical protein [Mycobacterium]MCV6990833.1 hypothetical protein [Mycobacterium bouchedurhonense]MCV6997383.1 hypothetical protein [Mycobacterium timonense]QWY65286.1 hypothetical protein BJP78_26765 [Mycobacterium avium subsp. hominissuis]
MTIHHFSVTVTTGAGRDAAWAYLNELFHDDANDDYAAVVAKDESC